MEKSDSEIHKQEEPDVGRGILRFMGFVLMVDIISLLFGFAFFLIAYGLVMALIRFGIYWQRSQRFVRRLVLGSSTSGTTVRLTPISTVLLFISTAMWASLIGLGVWFLVDIGFWRQNLIWIATH